MVSIGRWSDPWSFSVAMWHFTRLFTACSFPHTRSIAVLSSGKVIVPGGISSCISCWIIPSTSSSALWSCLMYSGGFHSGWCRLKSPPPMMAWYSDLLMFRSIYSISGVMRFSSWGL